MKSLKSKQEKQNTETSPVVVESNNEHVDRISGCLYAVLLHFGGSVRITKKEIEAMGSSYDFMVSIDKDSGDLLVSVNTFQGQPN